MSSNVGRNSLIMASGTMASRITGQIRTVLLAACLGTTGIAANAYQTGAMIPQVLFTVISGGIFNAVLVPQIVRTLKEHDAQDRLNKLITLSIAMLAAMTLLMMAATPLLTMLYLDSSWGPAQRALVNSFTLWCMPQIFFYGLYTVLGQILAAKDNFITYAWSSVGANVISCAGFTVFLTMFGQASRQPLEFWTGEKVMLTAGTWTLGVAFQALVLFVPLMRMGLKYRPQWGLSGIGLKSMGPVAAWSVGVMGVQELANIVNARITNGAPFAGGDLYGIAGNGSYQNAFTLYILPYSLIAVSVGTAIFPKISRAVADRNLDEARNDLSGALRNVGVMMMYFTMAIVIMPVPITIALLPSVNVPEAQLIAGPMTMLALGLPLTSAYLLIQRTFFAFEDGKHPFLFQLSVSVIQVVIEIGIAMFAPPRYWTAGVGLAMTVGYLVSFPSLVIMLRKRFEGHLDGRRIALSYLKALFAAVVAGAVAMLLTNPLMALLGASLPHGRLNWFQALGFCVVMTIVTAVIYAVMLIALRCEEFTSIIDSVMRRVLHRGRATAQPQKPAPVTQAPQDDQAPQDVQAPQTPQTPQKTADQTTKYPDGGISSASARNTAETALTSGTPMARMTMATPTHQVPHHALTHNGVNGTMKPQLGDTLFNRYTLVTLLRDEPGVQAWKATDRVLAHDCQLFVLTDSSTLDDVAAAATVLGRKDGITPVLQFRKTEQAAVLITRLESGLSLTEYLHGPARDTISYEAMRSIIGEAATVAASLQLPRLSTDTIRIASTGVEIADAPLATLLTEPSNAPEDVQGEQLSIRQLASVLYSLITRTPSSPDMAYDIDALADDIPGEFHVILTRGLGLTDKEGDPSTPMLSLGELTALLGDWTPVSELADHDLAVPNDAGTGSIATASLVDADPDNLIELPDGVVTTERLQTLTIQRAISEQEAAEHAEKVITEKNRETVSQVEEAFSSPTYQDFEKKTKALHNGEGGTPADNRPSVLPKPSLPLRPQYSHAEETQSVDLFNDFSFQTYPSPSPVSDDFAPGEETTRLPIISDPNMPTMALDVSSMRGNAQAASAQPGTPAPTNDATIAMPGVNPAAVQGPSGVQPPSFTPKVEPESDDDDDNLSDRKLFGSMTTTVVAIIVGVVVVIGALAFAIITFTHNNSNPQDPKVKNENQWPGSDDYNKVPFGDEQSGDTSQSGDSQNKSASGDDIEMITVTDAYFR